MTTDSEYPWGPGFKIFRKPRWEHLPYGPQDKQKLFFPEHMAEWGLVRPHQHQTDIMINFGAQRSGKSSGASGRGSQLSVDYEQCNGIVGSIDYRKIKNTTLRDFQRLFSQDDNFQYLGKWKHPFVIKYPTREEMILELWNGSQITFVNLKEEEALKGLPADWFMIEEGQDIDNEDIWDEGIGRLDGTSVPVKMLMVTANTDSIQEWQIRRWDLERFYVEGGVEVPFEGLLVGPYCACQTCACGANFYDNGFCENGHRKLSTCPGNQQYTRILFWDSTDNQHKALDHTANLEQNLSRSKFIQFGRGRLTRDTSGLCYADAYHDEENLLEEEIELDPELPLVWTHDWNKNPMCSVILQEIMNDDYDYEEVYAIDTIVEFKAGAHRVLEVFLDKYGHLAGITPVHLYGDPAGLYGGEEKAPDRPSILYQGLVEAGFEVNFFLRPVKFWPRTRIDTVNTLLRPDKNNLRRFKINKSLGWVRESAKKTKWNNERTKEDTKADRRAFYHGTKEDYNGRPLETTHIMAAVGYYFCERFPLEEQESAMPFYLTGDGKIVEIVDGDVVERTAVPIDEDEDTEVYAEMITEDESMPTTMAGVLGRRGLWPDMPSRNKRSNIS